MLFTYYLVHVTNNIGKTNRQIKTRIIEHMNAIRRKDQKSPVARHFNKMSHSILDLNVIVVIEQITVTQGWSFGAETLAEGM